MSSSGKYTEDEVRAIIDRALRTDLGASTSHEELLAVAAEVGIPAESIERAAREVESEREAEAAKSRIAKRRRRGFATHAFAYFAVNAFLFAVNFLTTPGEWWALFPLFGWGLGLLFHAWGALSREVSAGAIRREQKRMRGERSKLETGRAFKELRAAGAGAPGSLDVASREFSSAVQDRVGRILSRAAAELRSQESRGPTRVRVDPPVDAELVEGDADEATAGEKKRRA